MSTVSASLVSRSEAVDFVERVLGLDDIEKRLATDKLVFLNNIIYEYHCKVPFHNLDLLALPVAERRIPTTNELKKRGLSGRGGLCYQMNGFLYFVLGALGYEVTLARGTVNVPGDHVLIIARAVVTSEDMYLIEAGCGHPTLQAIPLDFEEESSIYTFSFCTIKFVRKEHGIARLHKVYRGSPLFPLPPKDESTSWFSFYHFNTDPSILEDIAIPMEAPYTNPESIFLRSIRVICFPMGKLLGIKDNAIVDDQNGQICSTELRDSDAIMKTVCRLFPVLSSPREIVEMAVKMWENVVVDK
ncbi:uncharacterized protein LOC106161340 [Lingula anatina]|uniref:arylamine N-acetyltransferase n=1 Tax=Lingula anatina TaxID=7574 RepID=A0A1S3I644_LINAN|nr:uncharacterized protein LOC106161340 [Lingula anatina]|eukprot:XP_013393727.1 uncharacterized protein LOC106161340 [Lingula anatina]